MELRNPIDILRDLSQIYNSLDTMDARRADITDTIGGKYRSNILSSILTNFDLYDKMMQDYGKLIIELSNSVRKEREEVEKISKDLSLKLDHLNYINNKKCNKIENKVSVVMWSIPSILLLLVLIL